MAMTLKITVFVLSVVVVNAQEIHFGKCKNITTQPDFDVEKYAGSWYDIEKFYFAGQMNKRCVVAKYTLRADGKIDVINMDITADNQNENTTGIAYYTDANVKSKLTVQLGSSPKANYWVVATDYDTYSLIWSCTELVGLANADFAWILSRKPTLDESVITMLKQRLQKDGIATDGFQKTNQEGCSFGDVIAN